MARRQKGALLTLLLAAAWAVAVPVFAQAGGGSPAPGEPAAKPSDKPSEGASQTPAAEPKAGAALSPAATPETRQEQIEVQTKELYRLSAELRAEVGKTYKDTLSLAVLKKAEEIEKLAKSLKALMNAEAADNKHK